jgi:hypothetical protein
LEQVQISILNRFRPYIGGRKDFVLPVTLKSCRVIDAGGVVLYGEESRRVPFAGRISEHWSGGGLRRAGPSAYSYSPPNINGYYINIGTQSNVVFTDTTVTFDNTDAVGGIVVGDLIYWLVQNFGGSAATALIPAVKVASIAAPSVVCDLLFARSYYDETYAPTTTSVLVHEWAPGQVLTGDLASGSPTVSNVSPTTILQVGDWVSAASGIPANTRVTAVGATATLSRNANATVTGARLYWGKLINLSKLTSSVTWDPASLTAGTQTTTTVAVTGAALGDVVVVGFDKDLQGMQLTAYVSSANTVTVVLRNGTAGTLDLASGILSVDVWKR